VIDWLPAASLNVLTLNIVDWNHFSFEAL